MIDHVRKKYIHRVIGQLRPAFIEFSSLSDITSINEAKKWLKKNKVSTIPAESLKGDPYFNLLQAAYTMKYHKALYSLLKASHNEPSLAVNIGVHGLLSLHSSGGVVSEAPLTDHLAHWIILMNLYDQKSQISLFLNYLESLNPIYSLKITELLCVLLTKVSTLENRMNLLQVEDTPSSCIFSITHAAIDYFTKRQEYDNISKLLNHIILHGMVS